MDFLFDLFARVVIKGLFRTLYAFMEQWEAGEWIAFVAVVVLSASVVCLRLKARGKQSRSRR
jgi:hypothetical protein